MKKINSNDYGATVIGIGLLFLLFIPAILFLLNKIVNSYIVTVMIYISIGIGAIIELAFWCHLSIELKQDKKISEYYEEHPDSTKTPQEILDDSDS